MSKVMDELNGIATAAVNDAEAAKRQAREATAALLPFLRVLRVVADGYEREVEAHQATRAELLAYQRWERESIGGRPPPEGPETAA